jgi:hypothetical protein
MDDGTSGQDRESYTDDQDRDTYEPATATKERNESTFVILREIGSVEELAELMSATGGNMQVFAVMSKSAKGKDKKAAIRRLTVHDDHVDTGRYVGVPSSSWKIFPVRTVVEIGEEES